MIGFNYANNGRIISFAENARDFLFVPKEFVMLKEEVKTIEQTIGYTFRDKRFLEQAFTRSSYHNEHTEVESNEVMEFIGDSVLSLIVVNELTSRYVDRKNGFRSKLEEGDLTSIRSFMVNKSFLSKKMKKLDLHRFLRMSVGDEKKNVGQGVSVLEDLFESIVGAIYLDSGENVKETQKIIAPLLEINKEMDEFDGKFSLSYKNLVKEWCEKHGFEPEYITDPEKGGFISRCVIVKADIDITGLVKSTKKEAEKAVAEMVYPYLEDVESSYVSAEVTLENAVNMLQEYCHKKRLKDPVYTMLEDVTLADNSHNFKISCFLNGIIVYGYGDKKKDAKKQSAYDMLKKLGIVK